MKRALFVIILGFFFMQTASAEKFDYKLKAEKVAEGSYLFIGKEEDFSFENGGNIVNTGFIVTDTGIIVIDTGSSKRYGEQMLAEIRKISDKPIYQVINTHFHPDHFLGNQAFKQTAPIAALAATKKDIQTHGGGFTDNLYRMVGDWMKGTDHIVPDTEIKPGLKEIGGHQIEFIKLGGHTESDLVVFDRTTGVLFAGDLVFYNRTLTTPHAIPKDWLKSLDFLQKLPFKVLVPGHGKPVTDASAINQTRDYLKWLVQTLTKGAENGLSMNEVMQTKTPKRFQNMALVKSELNRSVVHLFPGLEKQILKRVD